MDKLQRFFTSILLTMFFAVLLIHFSYASGNIGGTSGGYCLNGDGYAGGCAYAAYTTFYTNYLGYGGNGKIEEISSPIQSPLPVTTVIQAYDNNYAQSLITCPVNPNPTNTQEYFISAQNSFIGGDRCLASIAPLLSTVLLTTTTTWGVPGDITNAANLPAAEQSLLSTINKNVAGSAFGSIGSFMNLGTFEKGCNYICFIVSTPASSEAQYYIVNVGNANVQNIAYEGQSNLQGKNAYNISNGYNTNSYVFQQFPSSVQKGIWSWNANFADLSNADVKDLYISKTLNNLIFYTYSMLYVPPYEYYYWFCKYTYDYSFTAQVNYLHNANVIIPSAGGTKTTTSAPNYGTVGGAKLPYTQVVTNAQPCTGSTSFGGNCPFSQPTCPNFLYRGGATVICPPGSNYGGISVVNNEFYLVSANGGTLTYNGNQYNNLNVYSGTVQIPGDICANNGAGTYNCRVFYNEIFFYPYSGTGIIGSSCGSGFIFYYQGKYYCSASGGGSGQTGIPTSIVFGTSIKYYWLAYRNCKDLDFSCTYSMGYMELPPWTNTTIVPYLTYNISMPSTFSDINNKFTFLNNSYDLYSPHNFLNPQNSLDPFPIYTNSRDIFNYNNTLSILPSNFTALNSSNQNPYDTPTNTLVATITGTQASTYASQHLFYNFKVSGGLLYGSIKNPQFITESPNDYIYVLNYSYSCGLFCIHKTINSNIYILRMIPQGYYNMTTQQPDTLPTISTSSYANSLSKWMGEWASYWNSSILAQSQNLYVTGASTLSTVHAGAFGYSSGFWSWLLGSTSATGSFNFLPTAIATDYAGDLFILGKQQPSGELVIGRRASNGATTQNTISEPKGYKASNEFTASPGGQYLFTASAQYGNISIFNGAELTYFGNISLAFNSPTYGLDISQYLKNGGPYGSATVAGTYFNTKTLMDSPSFHHPIAIFESDGILYVLDNWSFNVTTDGGQKLASKILLLRAFSGNGTEIPIDPFNVNDLLYPNGNSPSGSQLTNVIYPPYGWPLSVNISVGSNKYVTYCAVGGSNGCTYTPLTLPVHAGISLYPQASVRGNNGFQPIGPQVYNKNPYITSGYIPFGYAAAPPIGQTNITMSMDFNNTGYITALVSNPGAAIAPGLTLSKNAYRELIVVDLNIFNYTKTNQLQNTSYLCYISQNSSKYPNSPCIEPKAGSELQNILNLTEGPFIGVPSPLGYLEAQGYPQRYLNLPNVVSLLIPTGTASQNAQSSSNANSITSNGCAQIEGKQQCLSQNNQQTISEANPSLLSSSISTKPEYLHSTIQGYFLIPYNISYTLKQQWSSSTITGQAQGDPPPVGSAACIYTFPSDPNTQTNIQFGAISISPSSSTLNESIEGGPIYLQYISSSRSLYQPNASDVGMFITPHFGYSILTNRLLGEIYVNQSVPSHGHIFNLLPEVINQTHLFNYVLNTFVQIGAVLPTGVSSIAAYQTETAVPITPPTVKQKQITGYYLPNYYSANNKLSFSSSTNGNTISLPELFSTFQKEQYAYNVTLNLTKNNNVLGYNRFMYVLADRFNNYIFVPISVDLGNVTTISLANSTTINALNPNETTITIAGSAGYYPDIFDPNPVPLPAGSQIYLYYQKNINYYSPKTFGLLSQLTQYQQYCAFGPNPQDCVLANPLNVAQTLLSFGTPQYSVINYHTQYQTNNQCAQEPDSLISPSYIHSLAECNIYGLYGLPMTGVTNQGNNEYCVPNYSNGTGTLTSQIGLMAIVSTNAQGDFNYNFNECGTGTGEVIAQYYGGPYPQPQPYLQQDLAQSQTFGLSINPQLIGNEQSEYTYTYFPNQTISIFPVGNFVLSFGNVQIPLLIIIVIGFMFVQYLYYKRNKQHNHNYNNSNKRNNSMNRKVSNKSVLKK